MPKKPMKYSEQNGVKQVGDALKINGLGAMRLVRDEGVAGSNPATPTNTSARHFQSARER
jgi:hypothetical protein